MQGSLLSGGAGLASPVAGVIVGTNNNGDLAFHRAYFSIADYGHGADSATLTVDNGATTNKQNYSAPRSLSFAANYSDSVQVMANTIYHIELFTAADNQLGSSIGSASSNIAFDQSFSGASAYTLILSDGVGNAPLNPVPVPSTMLLFSTGIAGLAAVGRRKRS